MSTLEQLDAERFREVIGHFASGVTVVTALDAGQAYGTTASAVCSLSLEPPMLLVCMNRDSATGAAIDRGGRFAVNILSAQQAALAVRFARPGGDFAGLAVEPGAGGEPLLAEALAAIECRVVERAAGGTHQVFIAAAERAEARPGGAPLAYFRGEFGRLGPLGDSQESLPTPRRGN